jgi:hypothetical protein
MIFYSAYDRHEMQYLNNFFLLLNHQSLAQLASISFILLEGIN